MRIRWMGVFFAWCIASSAGFAQADRGAGDLFETKVRPLLVRHCVPCHGPGGSSAGFRFDRPLSKTVVTKALAAIEGRGTVSMPPSGLLPNTERNVLGSWLRAGGVFPSVRIGSDPGWAFRPLTRVSVPRMDGNGNVIDAFVRQKLKRLGLRPAPAADRATWLRRVTFDLVGLPPSPSDVDEFLRDKRPDAYERVVDRLLRSPAYGERWGRLWLDVARYADTHGYDKDKRRDAAWRYRDWVISALNADMPWSRFVSYQIAGDVLSQGAPEGIAAAGFLAAGPWDFVGHVELADGTTEKLKTRSLDRDDYVSAAMGAFNSVTVHCARCHDHKFDPIPQSDYYRLQAVFAGIERGNRVVQENAGRSTSGSPTNGWHGPIAARPDEVQWVQVTLPEEAKIDSIRLIPARPTDFVDTPGFGFPKRWKVETATAADFGMPTVVFDRTDTDDPNPGDSVVSIPAPARPIRSIRVTATLLWPRTGDHVFALAEIQMFSGGVNVARRGLVTSSGSIEQGRWSRAALVDGHDSRGPLGSVAYSVVPVEPRPIHLLARGEVTTPREAVAAGALRCVTGIASDFNLALDAPEGERRVALARWLTDNRNVLTWRSAVNRVWGWHFGTGLVDTPNDFGAQGGRPSHPELLDWLAAWFRDSGQSLKKLHRLIVLSETYRQSSIPSAAGLRLDSMNRNLSWFPRRRLDAEQIRDAVLAASGTLRDVGGGPGYDLFQYKEDHSPVYDHDAPGVSIQPVSWRRSVYRFVVRSVPNPFLEAFDAPDPNQSVPTRNTTLTALQALTLMNDAFVLDQSIRFAKDVQSKSPRLPNQIRLVLQRAIGRSPAEVELSEAKRYVGRRGLAAFCRLVFNMTEFQFVD